MGKPCSHGRLRRVLYPFTDSAISDSSLSSGFRSDTRESFFGGISFLNIGAVETDRRNSSKTENGDNLGCQNFRRVQEEKILRGLDGPAYVVLDGVRRRRTDGCQEIKTIPALLRYLLRSILSLRPIPLLLPSCSLTTFSFGARLL